MKILDKICTLTGLDNYDDKEFNEQHPGREGVKNSYQVLALYTIILNLIVLDIASIFLTNILSILYPLKNTIRLIIENDKTSL